MLFIAFFLSILNYTLAQCNLKNKYGAVWYDGTCGGSGVYTATENVYTLVGTKRGNTLVQSIDESAETFQRIFLQYETCTAWITQYNGQCNYKYSLENCVTGVTVKCRNHR